MDHDEEYREVEQSPDGHYTRFDHKLGEGAYKSVWLAYDNNEGRDVAWNCVALGRLPSKEQKRLSAETDILAQLDHKHIIDFYEVWANKKKQQICFTTEIVTSGTLKQYLRRVKQAKRKVLKKWCRQILSALSYLHSRSPPIIHRDLKCDNIFINGSTGDIRIGDLGLSTAAADPSQSVVGTPQFMAPELFEENYTKAVDVYAFGMVLLEMCTGEYPYQECLGTMQIYKKVMNREPPAGLARVKDREVRAFIELCLAPADQRLTANELLEHPFLSSKFTHPNELETIAVEPRKVAEQEADMSPPKPDSGLYDPHEPRTTPNDSRRRHTSTPVDTPRLDAATLHVADVCIGPDGWASQTVVNISLKLQVRGKSGHKTKNIKFDFDTINDTSVKIAEEMAGALELPQTEMEVVVRGIDSIIARNISPPPQPPPPPPPPPPPVPQQPQPQLFSGITEVDRPGLQRSISAPAGSPTSLGQSVMSPIPEDTVREGTPPPDLQHSIDKAPDAVSTHTDLRDATRALMVKPHSRKSSVDSDASNKAAASTASQPASPTQKKHELDKKIAKRQATLQLEKPKQLRDLLARTAKANHADPSQFADLNDKGDIIKAIIEMQFLKEKRKLDKIADEEEIREQDEQVNPKLSRRNTPIVDTAAPLNGSSRSSSTTSSACTSPRPMGDTGPRRSATSSTNTSPLSGDPRVDFSNFKDQTSPKVVRQPQPQHPNSSSMPRSGSSGALSSSGHLSEADINIMAAAHNAAHPRGRSPSEPLSSQPPRENDAKAVERQRRKRELAEKKRLAEQRRQEQDEELARLEAEEASIQEDEDSEAALAEAARIEADYQAQLAEAARSRQQRLAAVQAQHRSRRPDQSQSPERDTVTIDRALKQHSDEDFAELEVAQQRDAEDKDAKLHVPSLAGSGTPPTPLQPAPKYRHHDVHHHHHHSLSDGAVEHPQHGAGHVRMSSAACVPSILQAVNEAVREDITHQSLVSSPHTEIGQAPITAEQGDIMQPPALSRRRSTSIGASSVDSSSRGSGRSTPTGMIYDTDEHNTETDPAETQLDEEAQEEIRRIQAEAVQKANAAVAKSKARNKVRKHSIALTSHEGTPFASSTDITPISSPKSSSPALPETHLKTMMPETNQLPFSQRVQHEARTTTSSKRLSGGSKMTAQLRGIGAKPPQHRGSLPNKAYNTMPAQLPPQSSPVVVKPGSMGPVQSKTLPSPAGRNGASPFQYPTQAGTGTQPDHKSKKFSRKTMEAMSTSLPQQQKKHQQKNKIAQAQAKQRLEAQAKQQKQMDKSRKQQELRRKTKVEADEVEGKLLAGLGFSSAPESRESSPVSHARTRSASRDQPKPCNNIDSAVSAAAAVAATQAKKLPPKPTSKPMTVSSDGKKITAQVASASKVGHATTKPRKTMAQMADDHKRSSSGKSSPHLPPPQELSQSHSAESVPTITSKIQPMRQQAPASAPLQRQPHAGPGFNAQVQIPTMANQFSALIESPPALDPSQQASPAASFFDQPHTSDVDAPPDAAAAATATANQPHPKTT